MRQRLKYSTKLPGDLVTSIKGESSRRGVTQQQIICSALTDFFTPEENEKELLLRKLSHIESRQKELLSDVELLSETLGLFIQVWFANTHELPETEKERATKQGEKRFEKFLGMLEQRMKT